MTLEVKNRIKSGIHLNKYRTLTFIVVLYLLHKYRTSLFAICSNHRMLLFGAIKERNAWLRNDMNIQTFAFAIHSVFIR